MIFFSIRTSPGTGPLDLGRNKKLRSTYHGSSGQQKIRPPEERSADTNSAVAGNQRTPWLKKLTSRFSTRYALFVYRIIIYLQYYKILYGICVWHTSANSNVKKNRKYCPF